MTKTSDPARALLGWAARHPAPAHEEISPCPSENREKRAEYSGTPAHIGRALRPVENIAAGVERMSA